MFGNTITFIGESLYSPSTVWDRENQNRSSIVSLMLIFFLASLLAGLASYSLTQHEGIKEFQVEMGVNQAKKMMPGLSEDDEAEMRNQVREQIYSPVSVIMGYVSLVFGVAINIVLAVYLFQAYMVLTMRFAGGEETPVQIETRKGLKEMKHRSSLILAFYRNYPLLIGGLLASLLLLTRSRESLYNIASLEEMTRKMTVNLTLYGLFFEGSLSYNLELVLNVLTSPFWWWSGWVCVEGMKKVWKVTGRKALFIFLGWVVLSISAQLGIMQVSRFFTA